METFIITLESVLMLLGIGLIGFTIISKKIIPLEIMRVLSPLAIDIALPCLVFSNIIIKFDYHGNPDWWHLPLWWMAFTAVTAIITLACSYIPAREYRSEFMVSLFYQNAIFLPLALLSGIMKSSADVLVYLFLFTMFYPAFFFNTYHLFFNKRNKEPFKLNWAKIKNPVLLATAAALFFKLTDTAQFIPDFIIAICTTLGAMAVPLIFLIIGGSIYIDFKNSEKLNFTEISKFILCKNILIPIIILALIYIVRPTYEIALILTLQGAAPPITAVPIITERMGGKTGMVNQYLIASFLIALITIPLVMFVFNRIYA